MLPLVLSDADALVLAALCGGLPAAAAAAYVAWLQRRRDNDVKEIREKVAETHTQVSVNGHSQDKPTVLDRLEDTVAALEALRGEMSGLRGDVETMQRDLRRAEGKLDRHVEWHITGSRPGRG